MAKMGRPPTPPAVRFARFENPVPSGCIEWTGLIDKYGYGQFHTGGRHGSNVGAHRWAYEHYVGPIPAGLQIDHLCRNRRCVNPVHLEAVTPLENGRRSLNVATLNALKTHCIHGHPLCGDNIYVYLWKNKPKRACRTCKRARDAANYRKRRAA